MSDNAVSGLFPIAARSAQDYTAPQGKSAGKVVPVAGKVSPRQPTNISATRLNSLVEKLNTKSLNTSPSLRFQIDLQAGTSVIQVFDRVSGELIRQIPPEKAAALENDPSPVDLTRIDELV